MAKFKQWDIVTTVDNFNRGIGIEAVVDFQQWDKVYISEWWRNLQNPIRYILPAEILYKKNKWKLTITLQEINGLMASQLHIKDANYNEEPSVDKMKPGDTFCNESRRYEYVGELDWEIVWSCEWYFCVIDENDVKQLFRTREDVCKKLFNLSEKDVEVI